MRLVRERVRRLGSSRSCLLVAAHVLRASSLGVLKDRPSIDMRTRCPLPHDASVMLRSRAASSSTRSVHAVSHDFDGLLHLSVAGLLRPATDLGIHHVSGSFGGRRRSGFSPRAAAFRPIRSGSSRATRCRASTSRCWSLPLRCSRVRATEVAWLALRPKSPGVPPSRSCAARACRRTQAVPVTEVPGLCLLASPCASLSLPAEAGDLRADSVSSSRSWRPEPSSRLSHRGERPGRPSCPSAEAGDLDDRPVFPPKRVT